MCISIDIIVISVKHALITPVTLAFDLSTQNHITCRIAQDYSLYKV